MLHMQQPQCGHVCAKRHSDWLPCHSARMCKGALSLPPETDKQWLQAVAGDNLTLSAWAPQRLPANCPCCGVPSFRTSMPGPP